MTLHDKLDFLMSANGVVEGVNYPFKVEGVIGVNTSNVGISTGGIILYYMVNQYTQLDFSDFTAGVGMQMWEIKGYKNATATTLSSGRNGFYGTYPDTISIEGYEYISIALTSYGTSGVNTAVDLTVMKFS